MRGAHAILLGASSQIGLFALPRLVARGLSVWAVSRRPRPEWYPVLEGVEWVRHADEIAVPGRQPQFLLSTGPLSLAADWLTGCAGVARLVALSTTSIASKSASPDASERQEMAAIAAGEEVIVAGCDRQGVEWCLLRPTLVYGCGMDDNVSLLARFIERFGFLPLSRDACGLRQPVHADDVARTAVTALFSPTAAGLATPVCGGSTIAYRVMVERVFAALGKPCRILELPARLLAAAAHLSMITGRRRLLRPQMIYRQAVDLVFDDAPAREALQHVPRGFMPRREDFALPGAADITALAVSGPGASAG